MEKEILKEILMSDYMVGSINKNMDILLKLIPEIEDMICFPHNHPHHHLDVWEHTLLALSLAPKDFEIRLVLLLHDIGKPHSYQDKEIRHFKGHAMVSSEMSYNILKRLGFSDIEIEEICYLIKEHDFPITKKEISDNKELAKKKFQVQLCDALAHDPFMLEKRIAYLNYINEWLNVGQEQEEYRKVLTKSCYNVSKKV